MVSLFLLETCLKGEGREKAQKKSRTNRKETHLSEEFNERQQWFSGATTYRYFRSKEKREVEALQAFLSPFFTFLSTESGKECMTYDLLLAGRPSCVMVNHSISLVCVGIYCPSFPAYLGNHGECHIQLTGACQSLECLQ